MCLVEGSALLKQVLYWLLLNWIACLNMCLCAGIATRGRLASGWWTHQPEIAMEVQKQRNHFVAFHQVHPLVHNINARRNNIWNFLFQWFVSTIILSLKDYLFAYYLGVRTLTSFTTDAYSVLFGLCIHLFTFSSHNLSTFQAARYNSLSLYISLVFSQNSSFGIYH